MIEYIIALKGLINIEGNLIIEQYSQNINTSIAKYELLLPGVLLYHEEITFIVYLHLLASCKHKMLVNFLIFQIVHMLNSFVII